jgi:uncharacterized membrane protein YqaE (UPF0057 family)
MVKAVTGVHPSVYLPESLTMLSLLAILCPPLAVLIVAGLRPAAATFGLCLLGVIPGVRRARVVVDRYTVERRYDAVMRRLERSAA